MNDRNRHLTGGSDGFTLLELVVVLGLIGLLAAGLTWVLRGNDGNQRLRAGEASAARIFTLARTQAALHQTRTRVILLEDSEDPEVSRRWLGIVVEASERSGSWRAVDDGLHLPRGVHLWPERSSTDGLFPLVFPRATAHPEGTGRLWHYWEFGSDGRLDRVHRFVLTVHDQEQSASPAEAGAPIGGFALFPLGGIGFPDNPEDLR